MVRKKEFPLDYRRLFLSFFKSCLHGLKDNKYLDKYYAPGVEKEYCFAVFFEKPLFYEDRIQVESNQIKLVFTSADKFTSFVFYSAFLENRNRKVPIENNNEMELIKVREVEQRRVLCNQVLVQAASPLCIRKHNPETNKDYYYSYSHEEFKKAFLFVVKKQLISAGYVEEDIMDLDIEPISCKKVIVKHYDCNIEASLGKFMLSGDPNVLQYLLEAGCGSRKSSGFGMLELIANG